MREEFEKQSRSSPMADGPAGAGPANPANFDLAGWMAGTGSGSGSGSASNAAASNAAAIGSTSTSASGREGGGSARRRG